MNRAQKLHVVESLAEWLAPAVLAAALAWAGLRLALPLPGLAFAALAAFGAGFIAIRRTDDDRLPAIPGFEAAPIEHGVLELTDEVLMLDDPLVEPARDSRVVRLFEPAAQTPGELVDRIADFLGDNQRSMPETRVPGAGEQIVDASDALHAALANIRASLR
jgi:hypothetical protein